MRVTGMKSSTYLQLWVNASYIIHQDMHGHTGGLISMGQVVVIHNYGKQKSIQKAQLSRKM